MSVFATSHCGLAFPIFRTSTGFSVPASAICQKCPHTCPRGHQYARTLLGAYRSAQFGCRVLWQSSRVVIPAIVFASEFHVGATEGERVWMSKSFRNSWAERWSI